MFEMMQVMPLPLFISVVTLGYVLGLFAIIGVAVGLRTLVAKLIKYHGDDTNVVAYPSEIAVRNW